MRPERVRPGDQAPGAARKGPRLVPPRKKEPREVPEPEIESGGSHPMVTLLIVAIIALTGAFTFFSAVLMWLWFRNTGVNWMFQK